MESVKKEPSAFDRKMMRDNRRCVTIAITFSVAIPVALLLRDNWDKVLQLLP